MVRNLIRTVRLPTLPISCQTINGVRRSDHSSFRRRGSVRSRISTRSAGQNPPQLDSQDPFPVGRSEPGPFGRVRTTRSDVCVRPVRTLAFDSFGRLGPVDSDSTGSRRRGWVDERGVHTGSSTSRAASSRSRSSRSDSRSSATRPSASRARSSGVSSSRAAAAVWRRSYSES